MREYRVWQVQPHCCRHACACTSAHRHATTPSHGCNTPLAAARTLASMSRGRPLRSKNCTASPPTSRPSRSAGSRVAGFTFHACQQLSPQLNNVARLQQPAGVASWQRAGRQQPTLLALRALRPPERTAVGHLEPAPVQVLRRQLAVRAGCGAGGWRPAAQWQGRWRTAAGLPANHRRQLHAHGRKEGLLARPAARRPGKRHGEWYAAALSRCAESLQRRREGKKLRPRLAAAGGGGGRCSGGAVAGRDRRLTERPPRS